ncbi:NHLP bacteriocin export ABC transporter permease/ATPase subunit [Granulibacter bethesdensis]|uniref:NHLP bacteriocin export ABC transporter permease/ATPase subunit n=1 Tax=Granulibacter bethesdensis TaxID=364410 RepID=UPI000909F461|nr:NHLP bacteriocin export ABC transporter permease/ATPase subunit [Granulibacter bethesdensis]APH59867.1 ABC-type multidrug/protein/lipid transport system, ATPase component [Granulibacter bethesdensis]
MVRFEVKQQVICAEHHAYMIQGGEAALFWEASHQAGTRRFIGRLQDGDVVFGLSSAGIRLVILLDTGTSAEKKASDILAMQPGILAEAVDTWLYRLLGGLPDLSNHDFGDAEPWQPDSAGLNADMPAGEHLVPFGSVFAPPADRVLWCQVRDGAIATALQSLESPHNAALPCLSLLPFVTEKDSLIVFSNSLTMAVHGHLLALLEIFHQALLACLTRQDQENQDFFVRRLSVSADEDARVVSEGLAALTPGKRPVPMVAETDLPLAVALKAVAEDMGVALPPEFGRVVEKITGFDEEGILKALAAYCGLSIRRIRLRPDWWRHPGENMIGYFQDGQPVALIAGRKKWTSVHADQEQKKWQTVTAEMAATVLSYGYVVYRPFGLKDKKPLYAIIRFVLSLAKHELILVGIISLLVSLMGMASPFLSGMLVQQVIPEGVQSEVLQLVLAMLGVSLGMVSFELVRSLAVLRMETVLSSSMDMALWNHLLRLPASFFQRFGAGDLSMRADAINEIHRTIGISTITILISVIFSVFNLAVLFSYGMAPILLTIVICLVEIGLLLFSAMFNTTMQRQALANRGAMQTLTVQIFQGISKLRVAAAENRFLARWMKLFARDQAIHYRVDMVGNGLAAFGVGWNILVMAALIALVGFGAAKMSFGDYVTYSGISGQFVSAVLSLVGIISSIMSVVPLWERSLPILAEPQENAGGRVQPGQLHGDIALDHVTFTYPNGMVALRDISLKIKAGTFVAIVGPSGSGKSTLMRLLLGFDQPGSGSVLFDGYDLKDLDTGAVRRQLGVVLQQSRIETGSIYNNIAGAVPMSHEEAWEAASLAGLADDIDAMPMGLHTYVDDSGQTLSGGQKQRLLLARAIARHPRIMMLDEATSALDNITQAHVMNTLSTLRITRVVIAHRLSTIKEADVILVFADGRLVEQGNYQSLIAAGGVFAGLAQRQMA